MNPKVLGILAILFFLTACSSQASDESIKIGGVFHISGNGELAEYGIEPRGIGERNAALLAVEEINEQGGIHGIPLEIMIEDGGANSGQILASIQKHILINELSVVIGPTYPQQITVELAEISEMVIITPSTTSPLTQRSYFFNLWSGENYDKEFSEKYMKRYGVVASPSSLRAYNAVNLVADALKAGAITADEINVYLTANLL